MGRALLPQHDAGERELPPQSPPWRAGGPATLRVLILALLWRGSLSQPLGFTLAVPQSVSVQEGLCVFIPCNFTYPASSDTDNPSAQLYGQWFKEPATVGQDPPVASSVPSAGVSQETQGRFRLTGDPAHGDCSLQISDARRTDAGRYFLYIEKGMLDHTYPSNSDGTAPISPARGLPGTLLAGEPVTVTCTAPGRCSGSPPQVTWTGPFNDTARNVSAQLANGTWAHSSELSFTPGQGDNGKELVCTITYSSAQGPSTSRTIRLHISYPGTLVTNGSQLMVQEGDSLQFLFSLATVGGTRPMGENQLGLYRRWDQNESSPQLCLLLSPDSPQPGTGLNLSCQRQGLSISCSLRSNRPPWLQWQVDREPLAGNGSHGALQISSARPMQKMHLHGGWGKRGLGQPMQSAQQGGCKSLPGVSALLLTQHHKTPATHQTKGIQDRAATAQAPDELHYVSIEFSELQRKRGEPLEAPVMVYAEVRRK
uniref:Ig-like domain-containing protein n=1 Tax=Chrysemys picta bellii TaxID=8478 RepID=A0A8C3HU59_CHRPI